ncbi:MAG TPA: type IV toxin-antitoxin system AbiEi family antitoxin domain-containing protein [Streptosporangiaceae bacterium]|jgi:hypothetical protein
MPRVNDFDRQSLAELLRKQHGVIARGQARDVGISEQMLRHRIRAAGPWQVLLPGVYLTVSGQPAAVQCQMAALLYAGPSSLITGPAALFHHGIKAAYTQVVDVLTPVQHRDHAFVRIHRTTRMPAEWHADGAIRYVAAARAVADAARDLTALREVRAVVADAVQRRKCPLPLLIAEVRAGPTQASALTRQALAEVADGVRSVVEAELRDLISQAGLPVPMFNPRLYAAGGQFIAQPDCWWQEPGVAAEVDSREWHLSPQDWERTLERHARMTGHGILVVHVTPRRIRDRPQSVIADLAAALESARDRPRLPVSARAAN